MILKSHQIFRIGWMMQPMEIKGDSQKLRIRDNFLLSPYISILYLLTLLTF